MGPVLHKEKETIKDMAHRDEDAKIFLITERIFIRNMTRSKSG